MAKKVINLGDYEVSEKSFPYLIAEIGINHNGDMQIAKKLIDAANACSWNCVKFQKREPDIAVPEKQKTVMRDTPWGRMTYLEYKKRIEFGKSEYDYIDTYCKEKPIAWTASPWDIPSFHFLSQYNIPFYKVASANNSDWELLELVCKTGKPIVISGGMSTIQELDKTVEFVDTHAEGNFILMHTNSAYPAPQDELNLNVIKTLKERYDCLVGYSGHEENLEPTVIAALLGAKVIERHVTLSHDMWGTDQKSSLTIHAMDMLKNRLKGINVVLGDGNKVITEKEKLIREKLRGC